jgi:tetratricopeptide (TPR) repeat protein
MAHWKAFPYPSPDYRQAPEALRANWARLHAGDVEPLPTDAKVLAAWALFHAGEFEAAMQAGLAAGGAGITAANKAQAIHATYLEESERSRLAMFEQVAARAQAQAEAEPGNPNARYWLAYALGRYSQGISATKALAQGMAGRIKAALEATIALAPSHADAHVALGAYHAEIVDKLGSLMARTQGASKEAGLKIFRRALELNPGSPIALIEYANGLVMLDGDKRQQEAEQLYRQAATCIPADAAERLDVELARSELDD